MSSNLTPMEKYQLFQEYVEEYGYEKIIFKGCIGWFLFLSIVIYLIFALVAGTFNILLWAWFAQWIFLVLLAFIGGVLYNTYKGLLTEEGRSKFFENAKKIYLYKRK